MTPLPRPLNSDEVPGAEWCNRVLDYLRAILPLGSGTVRTEETGNGIALHALGGAGGGAGAGIFPGLVYVGGNRFYDADLVVDTDAVGEVIPDLSDGEKAWIKIRISAGSITDIDSISVTYEAAPESIPSNWDAGEYWFEVARWSTPICVNHLTGATQESTFYGLRNGQMGFWAVNAVDIPDGADSAQVMVYPGEGADTLEELVWRYAFPTPGLGNMIVGGGSTPDASDPKRGYVGMLPGEKASLLQIVGFEDGAVPDWLGPGAKGGLLTIDEADGEKTLKWVDAPTEDGAYHLYYSTETGWAFVLAQDYKYPTKDPDEDAAILVDYVRSHPPAAV